MMEEVNGYLNTVDSTNIGFMSNIDLTTLLLIAVAFLIIKGFALYKAARLGEKTWFWIILIFNTMGLLPIIYLYLRRNKKV